MPSQHTADSRYTAQTDRLCDVHATVASLAICSEALYQLGGSWPDVLELLKSPACLCVTCPGCDLELRVLLFILRVHAYIAQSARRDDSTACTVSSLLTLKVML